MRTRAWAILVMFFTTFLTSTAQIFYKKASSTLSLDIFSLITNYPLIIGMVLYAIGGILMIISFRGGEVSVLFPIVATSYIWVSFLSIYFLDETMNIFKWLGVLIIFTGIVFIGFGSKASSATEAAGVI